MKRSPTDHRTYIGSAVPTFRKERNIRIGVSKTTENRHILNQQVSCNMLQTKEQDCPTHDARCNPKITRGEVVLGSSMRPSNDLRQAEQQVSNAGACQWSARAGESARAAEPLLEQFKDLLRSASARSGRSSATRLVAWTRLAAG
jgi:hypothetical protein